MIRIVFFLVLATTCLTSAAYASGQKMVYALFSRGWPPMEMVTDGKTYGLALDILREVLPNGVELVVEPMPAPRKALYNPEGSVYTRLEAREWMRKDVDCWWSDPVIPLTTVLYSSAGAPMEYDGPESLVGKTIGCIRNYSYPAIEELFSSRRAVRYDVNSEPVLLRMLKARRIDAIAVDLVGIDWVIRNTEDVEAENFHVAFQPVSTVDLRFAFNKVPGWEKYLPEMNMRIRQIKEDGTLERLVQNYK